MSDGRKNNGGNKNAGRKSKAEEFKLIDQLDKLKDPVWAIKKMFEHIESGSEKMLEKYLAYRFGMPKQIIEQETKDVTAKKDYSKLSVEDLKTLSEIEDKLNE
jgi:hypothetical protein